MHFKIAVIFCAVYFFTSVLSTGLNENQIRKCINLIKMSRRNDNEIKIFEAEITKTFFGAEKTEAFFEYDNNVVDYINLRNLFLALAYEDNKIGDSFEDRLLTSFETEFFLGEFIGHAVLLHKQGGYLTREQLSIVFNSDHLNLTADEKNKALTIMNDLKKQNRVDDEFNTAECLLIALQIKPEGEGLYKKDIAKVLRLFPDQYTQSGCINRSELRKIFKGFEMANKSHNMLFDFQFKSNRPAAKELIELVLVMAERSKTVPDENENEPALKTDNVRSLISEFTTLDLNGDGILSEDEAREFKSEFCAENPGVDQMFDIQDKEEFNIADFLNYYAHI